MKESQPFSVGFKAGKPAPDNITSEYLVEKGFITLDNNIFSKDIDTGRVMTYVLSSAEIQVKKGGQEPILIANGTSAAYLESLFKTMSGQVL